MKKKANSLQDLIQQNSSANAYFASLPSYVQETILERAENIRSEDDLKCYANNLLAGDDCGVGNINTPKTQRGATPRVFLLAAAGNPAKALKN